ncbi:MAG: flagellar hook-associated protein FlgK [Desulfovibrionaceae bacterium]
MSISSIFQIGKSILTETTKGQYAVSKNIDGSLDPNYHKINTLFTSTQYGVDAKFTRAYNQYTERSFIREASDENRWTTQDDLLQNVQELFNESGDKEGIGKTLSKFFSSWSALAADPTNTGNKTELLGVAKTLVQMLQNADQSLEKSKQEVNAQISSQVDAINGIVKEIAAINETIKGDSGAENFTLLDRRDALTRELSQYIDIDITNSNADMFTIATKSGHTLVNGSDAFSLSFEQGHVSNQLLADSLYTGGIHYSGASNYEYTIEILPPGGDVGTANFRASIDGGKTWLTNPETGTQAFVTSTEDKPTKVGDLAISFDSAKGALSAGDSFSIVPKQALYWESATLGKINVTPQGFGNGSDTTSRVTGGSLAGLFFYRDNNVSKYKDQLHDLSKSIIWEVNTLYSQGASAPSSLFEGTVSIKESRLPLGEYNSGNPWYNKIQSGQFTIHEYDATGTAIASHAIAFDPATDSLEDVVANINAAMPGSAKIVDGALVVEPTGAKTIAFGKDSTGLLGALGMNSFFEGTNATDIEITLGIANSSTSIHTGSVNADGTINVGSNDIALAIAELSSKNVSIENKLGVNEQSTLSGYYNAITSGIGSDKANAKAQSIFYNAQAGYWYAKGQSEYGVNTDEELMLSQEYQNLYVAGTRIMRAAQEMMDSLLSVF